MTIIGLFMREIPETITELKLFSSTVWSIIPPLCWASLISSYKTQLVGAIPEKEFLTVIDHSGHILKPAHSINGQNMLSKNIVKYNLCVSLVRAECVAQFL